MSLVVMDHIIEERKIYRPYKSTNENLAEFKTICEHFKKYSDKPTSADFDAHSPIVRWTQEVGLNDLCPCGSGLKFKKCCGKMVN